MADKKKKTKKGDRIKSAPGVSQVKKQIDELTKERDELLESRNLTLSENESLKKKLMVLLGKIVENSDKEEYGITEKTNLLSIETDDCVEMLSKLVTKGHSDADSIESRVEELETRVTQQSMDIATLTKRALLLEYGLEDTLKCEDIEEVKARVKTCFLLLGNPLPEVLVSQKNHQPITQHIQKCPNGHPVIVKSVTPVHLQSDDGDEAQPDHKGYGETHIRFMNRELKKYIAKELSLERPSGADWRMLAERVGIKQDQIKRWRNMRLDCPMAMVLSEWAESEGATVRLLHRHLISPQMRCTILAKRITDFYEVD